MITDKRLPQYINDMITARRRVKMSQRELAKKIGVTPNYLSMVETNKCNPSLDMMLKICDELGLKLTLTEF